LADAAGDARVGVAAHGRHCRSLPRSARGITNLPPPAGHDWPMMGYDVQDDNASPEPTG